MRYNLATLARRVRLGTRKQTIVIRDIAPPATFATDLHRGAYKPVCDRWEAAIPSILAEYERTLSGMTTDSPADLQARLDVASSDLERLFILLDASLRDWSVRVEAWQRQKWRAAVLTATGVDLGTLIGPEDVRETLETYIKWNTDLIRDVSAQTRQRVSNAVFSGLQNRTPVREVAKSISEATGMARRRSMGIASDQLSKVTSALADERRREAGISLWKWRHSGKKHPRVQHRTRDGNVYADTAAGAGGEVEGRAIMAPPERNDWPGRPPWCGCRSQSVLVLDWAEVRGR